MEFRTHTLVIATQGFNDIRDLTAPVADLVRRQGLRDGSVLLFVPGATAALTTLEHESGAVADLQAAIERLAPRDQTYAHDARWGDGNGFAHVRAALIQADLEVPVADGQMLLGTWQQIVLCDFDNRPRDRRIVCQLRGTFARSR